RPVKEMGGVQEWMWKSAEGQGTAKSDVIVSNPGQQQNFRHILSIQDHGGRFEVVDEKVENEVAYAGKNDPYFYYRFQQGRAVLVDFEHAKRKLTREQVSLEASVLSQFKDSERYPPLTRLQTTYSAIRLYRNWSFGPNSPLRREQSTHEASDYLDDGGGNLALVLSSFSGKKRQEIVDELRNVYEGVEGIALPISGGTVQLFLEESGGRRIPATRLSDGTLRYLCLLAILLHPEPPPFIAIEEPELGLHPDLVHLIAKLLLAASKRMQIVITTHSRQLIDALSEEPEAVIICEREDGESRFERLDGERMKGWLDRYSLGELWGKGELGGNRW
ncbi:MAG: AAA family ATPase, partial [Acidobacteria bacterium]|nr:AAA family ATPase [Acidobacteriota bacterium]